MSAVVEGDAAVATRQRVDLGLEVTPVDQVAMGKDNRLRPRTLVYVVKANAVYLDIRHLPNGNAKSRHCRGGMSRERPTKILRFGEPLQ
jgi:hypothetical protein